MAIDPQAEAARRAPADAIPHGTIVAKDDVTIKIDEYRSTEVFAGTAVPPALVEAYFEQAGGNAVSEPGVVDADAPKRGRAPRR